jgi:hypothetical protein
MEISPVGISADIRGQTNGHEETNGNFSSLNASIHSSVNQFQVLPCKLLFPFHIPNIV